MNIYNLYFFHILIPPHTIPQVLYFPAPHDHLDPQITILLNSLSLMSEDIMEMFLIKFLRFCLLCLKNKNPKRSFDYLHFNLLLLSQLIHLMIFYFSIEAICYVKLFLPVSLSFLVTLTLSLIPFEQYIPMIDTIISILLNPIKF